jgi:DtxR family Mn-dependent transcriptional regulator
MRSPLDHLLMRLWAEEREGDTRDAALHGQRPLSAEARAALEAEGVREGLLAERFGERRLSERGEAVASALLRRHRLAERLLADLLELPEEEFERSACRFEHHLSERVADRVCTLLGHPTTCPHGRPIPPGDCCRARLRTVEPIVERLTEIAPHEEARVVFVSRGAPERVDRLAALGLSPGAVIRLRQKIPSYLVEAGETEIALDETVAREIFVSRLADRGIAPARSRAPRPGAMR